MINLKSRLALCDLCVVSFSASLSGTTSDRSNPPLPHSCKCDKTGGELGRLASATPAQRLQTRGTKSNLQQGREPHGGFAHRCNLETRAPSQKKTRMHQHININRVPLLPQERFKSSQGRGRAELEASRASRLRPRPSNCVALMRRWSPTGQV